MTSHADTLRGWANTMITNPDAAAAHLAGAAALDTLTKVQKVAELLDKMAEDNRRAATQLDWAAPGAIGRERGYTKAAELIREALGGTP